jgi:hypothetical protein
MEIGSLILGMAYLWLACVSDFVVPLYIGFVIDVLEKGEFHKVGPLCWQLFIIIVVRIIFYNFIQVAGAFGGLRA